MSRGLHVPCCLAMVLIALQAAAAPPAPTKPGGVLPPARAVTPTPMIVAVPRPFNLPACTASGTVTYDAADHAKNPSVERYQGQMTFTAKRDLWDVLLYTMNYNDRPGQHFLGSCTGPELPKGGDNPASAPPNSNFKRLESRTYQVVCAWPDGGLANPGPFRFEVSIGYFTNTGGKWSEKKGEKCGDLTVVK